MPTYQLSLYHPTRWPDPEPDSPALDPQRDYQRLTFGGGSQSEVLDSARRWILANSGLANGLTDDPFAPRVTLSCRPSPQLLPEWLVEEWLEGEAAGENPARPSEGRRPRGPRLQRSIYRPESGKSRQACLNLAAIKFLVSLRPATWQILRGYAPPRFVSSSAASPALDLRKVPPCKNPWLN